ncbi:MULTISPECIES: hypothetical protein [unclassified Microcoleus]|uniref:hypothetical protein n=1 Tax=unclassified Microcoleus TaxID=2642155 RepID=UPI002FD59760
MARFSDILRADELKAAKDKLETWQKLDRAAKQAAYVAAVGDHKRLNRASRIGFVQPFGAPDKFWYQAKVLAPASATPEPGTKEENDAALITALLTVVSPSATTGYVLGTAPGGAGNISAEAKKVQFAKVKLTERSGNGEPGKISRMTGLPYTKYRTNTVSTPFGVNAEATDKSEQAARKALRAALLGNPPAANRFVGFTPQGEIGDIVIVAAATTT